jgi:HEAT repeat protein
MPVTIEQVRAALEPEEPNYEEAAQLGPEALPHLDELVGQADALMASKAAYLTSLIEDPHSKDILKRAAKSSRAEVRAAAAGGASNLSPEAAGDVLEPLLKDRDVSVRKTALRSVPEEAPPRIQDQVESLSEADSNPALREMSSRVADRLRRRRR